MLLLNILHKNLSQSHSQGRWVDINSCLVHCILNAKDLMLELSGNSSRGVSFSYFLKVAFNNVRGGGDPQYLL